MKLPTVKGRNLLRQRMIFPDDFAGEVNLVFIAFLRSHQDLIDAWVPFVAQLSQRYARLHYYEFPVLANRGALYRTFLNEGMRAGIPDEATRARTVTLYLDKQGFRNALDIDNERQMWIYLFDRRGQALWRAAGQYTTQKATDLSAALNRSLSSNFAGELRTAESD
jgi:ATP10 protein